ncbi:uncharacterized protein LOC121980547 [Zingiber officinale]|uniref:C2H2-type domain-containing protein n=1 Tax=Zingiber officinale TaxID=94328 RepID=A0A8J5GUW7_ZINOF|nr:uncharacterized protein LOC121980547 [Zingiber officinale]KAG6506769.1 hypothetical protein ZIOFF_032098 [Zingiber officinale]
MEEARELMQPKPKRVGTDQKQKLMATEHQQQQQLQHSPRHLVASLRDFLVYKFHQAKRGRRRRIGCSGSFCKLRDLQRPEREPSLPEPCKTMTSGVYNSISRSPASIAASTSSPPAGGSFRGMHALGRLSVCYECHMVVDPINGTPRYSNVRATVFACADCGEVFLKAESLEAHTAIRHAVSELSPEDTGRKIVEIIFQSSWRKKRTESYKIERILKVRNTSKTTSRFEEYRDSIKNKAGKLAKKHPRSTADGNELMRFHCTTFACSLGLAGATTLCDIAPHCNLCSIIRDGFKPNSSGRITTMATSGRAHDAARFFAKEEERIAMLVCRVIAGRVRNQDYCGGDQEYDSISGCSNLDELVVFSSKAILPCFVVIYQCCSL